MELLQCIILYSALNGIDPKLTQAVIKTESNYNQNAVGQLGEIGLMQIRPEHVKVTRKQLFDPCTNVKVGTEILKRAMDNCKHKEDNTFVNCYNLGIGGGSRLRYPKKWRYYVKITANMGRIE